MIVLLILFLKKTCLHAYKFFFTACAHKHTKSLNYKDKQIYGNFLTLTKGTYIVILSCIIKNQWPLTYPYLQ